MHEFYYSNPSKYDLVKMREEAERKSKGDFYAKPESCVIHYHAAGKECNGKCESYPAV
jgi:hypothetical protein